MGEAFPPPFVVGVLDSPPMTLHILEPLLKSSPGGPPIPPTPPKICVVSPLWRFLTEKIAFQKALKFWSNSNAFSTPILECFGSVLGGQDGSKIHWKSIKMGFLNQSCFDIVFYIDFDTANWLSDPNKSWNLIGFIISVRFWQVSR